MIGPKSPLGLIAKGISCLLDLYNASVISSPERVTWLAGFVREFDLPFPRWNLCFSCSCNSVVICLRLALLC